MKPLADPTLRHRRYKPIKENGILSRIPLWDEVDWSKGNTEIGRMLGVTGNAVSHQRRKRGKPPAPRGGVRPGRGNATLPRR